VVARSARSAALGTLLVVGICVSAPAADPELDAALASLDSLRVSDHRVVRDLVDIGEDALPDVFGRLDSPNLHTALAAGRVIGMLGDETTVFPLLENWATAARAGQRSRAAFAVHMIVNKEVPRKEASPQDTVHSYGDALLEIAFCFGPWASRLDTVDGAPLLILADGFSPALEVKCLKRGGEVVGQSVSRDSSFAEYSRGRERLSFGCRILSLETSAQAMPSWSKLLGQPPSAVALVTIVHRPLSGRTEHPGDVALWAKCTDGWRFLETVAELVVRG